uniref:Uncharacterized protein n=1 Tax=Anopheles maculatus TaxID=74869 RepID=A0A182SM38_9DIPT
MWISATTRWNRFSVAVMFAIESPPSACCRSWTPRNPGANIPASVDPATTFPTNRYRVSPPRRMMATLQTLGEKRLTKRQTRKIHHRVFFIFSCIPCPSACECDSAGSCSSPDEDFSTETLMKATIGAILGACMLCCLVLALIVFRQRKCKVHEDCGIPTPNTISKNSSN